MDGGFGAGLLAAAGVLALYALGTALATAILGLAVVVAPWLAALIVTAVLLLVVGILAFVGVRRLQNGVPPAPTRTVENVHEDIEALKKGIQQ